MLSGIDCGITVIPKTTRLLMKKPRTMEPKTTRRLSTPIVPLHIPLQAIKEARSALPHGLRVSDIDCAILLFVERNRNLPFANWPKECRHYKALAKLCRLGYLRQKDWPKSFVITRAGYSMLVDSLRPFAHRHQAWNLRSIREHARKESTGSSRLGLAQNLGARCA
jgi:hypothetical protein